VPELLVGALSALGVLAGAAIAQGRLAPPALALWAAVAAAAFSVAGTAPGRGRADFLVFAGVVVGAAAAMLVSGTALAVGLSAAVALAVRARFADALLAGLPLMYGALAAGRPAAGIIPWTLAGWLQLVRALVDDVAARRASRPWLAVALAIGFVPASLLLPARAGYGAPYFLIALFAQLAVLVVATRLIVGRTDGLGVLLTGAMVAGFAALVAGRVA